MMYSRLIIGILAVLVSGSRTPAQQASPPEKEKPATAAPAAAQGGCEFRTDFSFGGFFTDMHGSQEKYRSDINLRSGVHLENFRLEVRPVEGHQEWFDLAVFRARGFGDVDPYENFQFHIRRNGRYNFRLSYSKDNYYFNLPGFAMGLHSDDSLRRRINAGMDVNLTKSLTLRTDYRNYTRSGNSFTSQGIFQSIFRILQYNQGRTDDYSVALDWRTRRVGVSFEQRLRHFRFDDHFRNLDPQGADPLSTNKLTGLTKNTPVRGMVPESSVTFTLRPSSQLDVLGRYTFSKGNFDFSRWELQSLRLGAGGAQLEQLALTQASTDQPQHRLDLNVSWDAASQWTVQNAFNTNQYRLQGDALLSYALRSPGSSQSLPLAERYGDTVRYRRTSNESSIQYTPSRYVNIRTAYRYTDRLWEEQAEGSPPKTHNTAMQSVMAGWSASSGTRWRSSLEFEHGWADQAFIRLEPLRFNRWSARGSVRPVKGWQFGGSLGIRDDLNATMGSRHEQDLREFSLQINWIPREDYLFDFSYGRTDILSATDIYFLLTVPRKEYSQYLTNTNYAAFHGQIPLHRRIRGQISYNIVDDSAGSFPLVFHQTAAGLSLKIQGPVWLDLGWRYVAYNEELYSKQDYAGHMLGVSMRFGF